MFFGGLSMVEKPTSWLTWNQATTLNLLYFTPTTQRKKQMDHQNEGLEGTFLFKWVMFKFYNMLNLFWV